jgi:hypothetical protein
MTIDFFVHPEHAILTGYPYKGIHDEYISHLKQILDKSKLPVLVNGLAVGEFDKLFPPERTLTSASHYIIDLPFDYGEVAPCDWDKFEEIVKQDNDFRVHGAHFGECTEGFAVQLFAYLKRKEHWHDWRGTVDKDAQKLQEKLRKAHESKGDFLNCGIKYGVVIAPPKNCAKIIKPGWIPFISKKHGNITYQLMDKDAVIYGKC